jgi:hypothetical protein
LTAGERPLDVSSSGIIKSDVQDWPAVGRWSALVIGLLVLAVAGYFFCYEPSGRGINTAVALHTCIFLVFLLAAQAALVFGVAAVRPHKQRYPMLTLLAGASWTLIVVLGTTILVSSAVYGFGTWSPEGVFWLGAVLTVFFGTQAAFLSGAPRFRKPRLDSRKPLWLSLVAGAFIMALVSGGLLLTLMSLAWILGGPADGSGFSWFILLAILPVAWVVWSSLFAALWTTNTAGYRRMYSVLLGGTFLELLITVPVDIQVRKRTDCYCAHGTFFALPLGILLAVWCFGPGLVLLFLTRRSQRQRRPGFCHGCGLDLRDSFVMRCPECNTPFHQSLANE